MPDLWIKEKRKTAKPNRTCQKQLKMAALEKARATASYARLRTEQLKGGMIPIAEVERIYAIGGLRMMDALKEFWCHSCP